MSTACSTQSKVYLKITASNRSLFIRQFFSWVCAVFGGRDTLICITIRSETPCCKTGAYLVLLDKHLSMVVVFRREILEEYFIGVFFNSTNTDFLLSILMDTWHYFTSELSEERSVEILSLLLFGCSARKGLGHCRHVTWHLLPSCAGETRNCGKGYLPRKD